MIKNYFKTAWRNIVQQAAFIHHIAGLASGMAVAMIIGLWNMTKLRPTDILRIRLALPGMMNQTFDGVRGSQQALHFPWAKK